MLTASFIGCGRLGKTIATLLHTNDLATIGGVLTSSLASSQAAVSFIGQGIACGAISDLPPSGLYIIATKDGDISASCEALAKEHALTPNTIVIHCSGALTSDSLIAAKQSGAQIASIHPVKSFANPTQAVASFKGTLCSIEGDAQAIQIITNLFTQMGAEVFAINKESKIRCHAAMSISNNFLVSLHFQAMQLMMSAGVDEGISKRIISNMMRDGLNNVEAMPHQQALTGPIQRGDVGTVADHLEALKGTELARSIYCLLGRATLPLTGHSDEVKERINRLLSS